MLDNYKNYGTDQMVSAVIVAAGKGLRMNSVKNKMFIEIGGIPIIIRTLNAFENCNQISSIYLVISENEKSTFQKLIKEYNLKKINSYVVGGSTRQSSVYNGLLALNKQTDIVLIHDGARPFVTQSHIKGVIDAAIRYGASTLGVPIKDTVKKQDDSGFIVETFRREALLNTQTPQAFYYDLIINAHRQAIIDDFKATDDAMLIERLGHEVKVVRGSYDNIKITTPDEIIWAELFLRKDGEL